MAVRVVDRSKYTKEEAGRSLWSRAVDVVTGLVATRGAGGAPEGGDVPPDIAKPAEGCSTCAKEAAALKAKMKAAVPAPAAPPGKF